MNFEDRLRSQLHEQTADIEIEPEGVDVLADRVRSRRSRRTAAAAIVALVVVAGLTGYLIGRGTDQPDRVATEGIEDDAEQGTPDEGADGDDAAAASAGGEPTDDLPDVALPDPGAALVFTNIEDDSSPGGYNVWQNGRAGDIYYVLSTAPGLTWEELEGQEHYGPDTLYTWDGDRWSNSDFGDRFVSEISSGDDRVLYAVSTGSVAGAGLEVGSSTDAGANWTWTPVDLSAQFPEGTSRYRALTASNDGTQLVVVHRAAGADWGEAIALAEKYGVDIDEETDEIFNIDSEGIEWIPDAYQVSPCQAAYNEYFDGRFAEYEEELYEPPFPYEGDLTDEQLAELRAWEEEQQELWRQRRLAAIEHMSTVAGCEEYHACLAESEARESALFESDDTVALFEELSRRAEAGEEVTDEEWMAAEEASAAIWDEYNDWMEESGCRVILYGDFEEPSPDDLARVTWEELGVIPPASWSGSTHVYLVEDGTVRPQGQRFTGSTGWLVDVRASAAGFEVIFDDTSYEPFEAEPDRIETIFTTWRSPDGTTWTSSTSSVGGYEPQTASIDGSSFSVAWTERDGSDLIRSNPDGTSDRLRLSDLAGDTDTNGYEIVGVRSGPYGIVAWASKWEEFREDGPVFDYSPDSIILYSPDGRGWGATPLPGADIADAIVGSDGVMVFLADPTFNGPETPPQPVLLGTAD